MSSIEPTEAAALDLRTCRPRPMEATLGGYPWLPRMIDKARAARAGTLGPYVHPCPIDRTCLALLGLDAHEFGDVVERQRSDDAVLAALQDRGIRSPSQAWFDPLALEAQLQRSAAR